MKQINEKSFARLAESCALLRSQYRPDLNQKSEGRANTFAPDFMQWILHRAHTSRDEHCSSYALKGHELEKELFLFSRFCGLRADR